MLEEITVEDKALVQLLKALKEPAVVRIGVLGSKDSRTGVSNSNATVGAAHEFGTGTHPRRSFLKEPLDDHLSEYVEKSGEFTEDAVREVIRSGTVLVWLKKLGVIAESVVLDAFKTRGFGKWAPWKKGYSNNTGDILVDTQQLKRSITSDVKRG